LQYAIFYNIILGLGKTMNSQNRFPALHDSIQAGHIGSQDLQADRTYRKERHIRSRQDFIV
jgi:hypothetical protein